MQAPPMITSAPPERPLGLPAGPRAAKARFSPAERGLGGGDDRIGRLAIVSCDAPRALAIGDGRLLWFGTVGLRGLCSWLPPRLATRSPSGKRAAYFPLLTTRPTFVPLGRDFPAPVPCETTLPFLTWLERAFLILPTAQ